MSPGLSILLIPAFFPTPERPTLGIFFRDQAKLLGGMGYDVHVAHLETRPLRSLTPREFAAHHFQTELIRQEGFTEHRCHGWNPGIQTRAGAAVWEAIGVHLVSCCLPHLRHPVVVHAHNAALAGSVAARIAERLRVPFVVTEHSSAVLSDRLQPFERSAAQRVYARANEVIAVSHALADRIRALAGDRVRPRVIPNAIDTEFFMPRAREGNCGHTRFGMVCNLVPIKRIDLPLRAIAELRSRGYPAELTVGGTGPMEPSLRQLHSSLRLGDSVRFLGATDRLAARQLIANSDCVLVTSDHETFGMILAEAMAMGRPVIATDCGGTRDFISSETGVLIPVGDQAALQEAMARVIDGRVAFNPQRLRAHIESTCSMRVVGSALRNVYSRICRPARAQAKAS